MTSCTFLSYLCRELFHQSRYSNTHGLHRRCPHQLSNKGFLAASRIRLRILQFIYTMFCQEGFLSMAGLTRTLVSQQYHNLQYSNSSSSPAPDAQDPKFISLCSGKRKQQTSRIDARRRSRHDPSNGVRDGAHPCIPFHVSSASRTSPACLRWSHQHAACSSSPL